MKKSFIFAPREEIKRSKTMVKTPTFVNKPLQLQPETYKYYVGQGNNSHLVRRIMSTRKNWEEISDSKQNVQMKWQQTNRGYNYQSSKKIVKTLLNHFQYHQELSNKEYMFRNVLQYCQLNKINAFQFLPPTFILNTLDAAFDNQQANFLTFYYAHISDPPVKQRTSLQIRKRTALTGSFALDKNAHTVHSKYEIRESFTSPNSKGMWILKPTFYNRGNGVHVFNTIAQLETLMGRYINGTFEQPGQSQSSILGKKIDIGSSMMIQSSSFVIQKYMQRPLLVSGRKFDIRVWVMITHQMKVLLFRQGYIRTSSFAYSLDQNKISDLSVHLTNNAVQKYNSDYCKYEKGNQLSFKSLKGLLEGKGKDYQEFISRMKEIIKITALSAKRRINRLERQGCFQIFGYDFMVDQVDCNPWLIEVNTNPCLEQSSPLLQQLLPRMLDDAFALTIDRIFPTPKTTYSYVVQNELNTQNLWDQIVDLRKS